MVRLTDRPFMAIAAYSGREITRSAALNAKTMQFQSVFHCPPCFNALLLLLLLLHCCFTSTVNS